MKMKEEFIVDIKGRKFVRYAGLLDLAHEIKIKSISTEIVQFPRIDNNMMAVAKAVVTTFDDRVFEDYGDASPDSVNKILEPHIVRIAITRAKARALRDLTNIGMTSVEEIMEEVKDNQKNDKNMQITEEQMKLLINLAEVKNMTEEMKKLIQTRYKLTNSRELNIEQASDLCRYLQRL